MNCKQGDLAFYIKSTAGNEGRVVEVLRFMGDTPEYQGRIWCRGSGPCWLVRSAGTPLREYHGELLMEIIAPDAFLSPIRPPAPEEQTTTSKDLEAVA